jgi:arginine decarboxylase, biosynthetic
MWDIQTARETYSIAYWGSGYFDINPQGYLVVRPRQTGAEVELYQLAAEIKEAGLSLPVLVRFTDILHNRVDTLCNTFASAMAEDGYEGAYTAVYPIKVNQQRRVVEEILRHGGERVGLEAGSKPEFMAVLALSHQNGGIIVCNGYKDREYIRLALVGTRLGHRVYIVVEKFSELELILSESKRLGVAPLIGIRVRLASLGAGKWQNTGGEKSKFGLSASQALAAVAHLKREAMLDSLVLLHVHMGSQIANIRDIQRGMREAARYYAELHRLGIHIRCVDVGGGLGVDYEGTRSRHFCSMNYGVQEYAQNVVHALWEVCTEQNLPHPDILTESGRAMTAHHAVLLTNVTGIEAAMEPEVLEAPEINDPLILHDLWRGLERLGDRSAIEAYHDAVHWLSEAQAMYTHGVLSLEQRARAEQLYAATCRRVRALLQAGSRRHREVLDELDEKLADKYFCNFSLFQSVPDVWAIDQIFPVVPLHRLSELPARRASIQDLTCDSDGRIDYYVDRDGIDTTLPLHPVSPGEPYLLGIFLVGAYQEILGDIHNLFGDTDSVNLEVLPGGEHRLTEPVRGDTIASVLRYVQFSADELLKTYQSKIREAGLDEHEREHFLKELGAGLMGYTYLEE